jgi:ATP-binding protein involved in chromosome partitioning
MSLFGEGGAKEVAKRLSELQGVPVPVLGTIPLSVSLRQAADQGDSIVSSDPQDPAAVAIIELAQKIVTAGSSRAGKNLGIKPN